MCRLLTAVASLVAVHRLSCSVASEIFLNQGLNSCPLHWQVDSQPLNHQGSFLIACFEAFTLFPFVSALGYGHIVKVSIFICRKVSISGGLGNNTILASFVLTVKT